MSSLRDAFLQQRYGAKRRGIAWEFTFEQWLDLWTRSGHLAERGRKSGCYVMARRGDVGPYSEANVEILPCGRNSIDARANHPEGSRKGAIANTGSGRGWTMKKGRYQVYVSKRYVGCFATAELARAAYERASEEHRSSLELT